MEREQATVNGKDTSILSVSDLNRQIKGLLEGQFSLLWVQGEISNFKAHSSGHYYFSLKDKKSQISAVMFRGFNSRLKFRPEDGMEVLIRARVTVYEPRGNYQILCETMEPLGAGALQKAYEQLKAKLKGEGLFDQQRKKALPPLPRHIALITSPTGAAVRDMLNVLSRRFKGLTITVIPSLVQGKAAAPSLVKSMELAQKIKNLDAIIIGRGGGSIEDLWAFNEEPVARAIANSAIPVISAVGHEVDFTIADFVADLRAPTPSAAAELVVQDHLVLKKQLLNFEHRLVQATEVQFRAMFQALNLIRQKLVDPRKILEDNLLRCEELRQRLERALLLFIKNQQNVFSYLQKRIISPQKTLLLKQREVEKLFDRLQVSMKNSWEQKNKEIENWMGLLDSLSPLKVLDRGYSVVFQNKKVISDFQQLEVGEEVNIQLKKGHFTAQVKEVDKKSLI